MSDAEPQPGDPQDAANIILQPAEMAGVWANFARVSQSPYEFTLDFIRIDFASNPRQGIVVGRVSVSPLFITQLIDALQQQWEQYARRSLPQEVYGGEQQPGTPDGDDGRGEGTAD